MAQNVTIAGASFSGVPSIEVPKTGGGTAVFSDTSPTTAMDSDVASGKIYFKADGTQSTGTATGGAGGIVITDETDTAGGTIRTITAVDLSSDTVTAGSMLYGVTAHDNTGTAVTGNIVTKTGSDLSASGDTVTVPAGYYASQTTKAVASGTEGTPTATKGTVSNNSVTVTPSVTNTAGYISGGTHTGTGVSVSASELVSGNKSITSAGNTDVTNYATASVAQGTVTAPATISGTSASVSTGTNTLTLTKTVSVTPTVSTAGYVSSGTAGNSSVSLTASVNTRSSSDLTASTLTVTAPSGYYASNATKTLSDQNLIAENIKKDIQIFGVTGTYEGGGGGTTWETVFNNTVAVTTPEDDYYLQTIAFGYTIDQNSVWKITWNGTPYECTATSVGITDFPPYAIGNDTIIHLQGGNNEPFYLQKIDTATLVVISSTSQTVSLKIEKQVSGGATLITKTITQNGTYDAEDDDADGYSSVTVNVSGGGGGKNVQVAHGTKRVASQTYIDVGYEITVAKTGTYNVYWAGWRSSTSGTNGAQLYVNGTASGDAITTFDSSWTNVQNGSRTSVSLTADDKVTLRARSRGNSYYMYIFFLSIEEV